jgi:hypothetical protein
MAPVGMDSSPKPCSLSETMFFSSCSGPQHQVCDLIGENSLFAVMLVKRFQQHDRFIALSSASRIVLRFSLKVARCARVSISWGQTVTLCVGTQSCRKRRRRSWQRVPKKTQDIAAASVLSAVIARCLRTNIRP